MKKVSLLKNNVIVPSELLRETSVSPETLHLTESRQYREHGLLHITDSAYEFFMLMEQQRVDQINTSRLSQLGSKMIDDSLEAITKNNDLRNSFLSLFRLDENGDEVSLGNTACVYRKSCESNANCTPYLANSTYPGKMVNISVVFVIKI